MVARRSSIVVLLGVACSSAAPYQRSQEPLPAQQQDDTARRVALLKESTPPANEILRSLGEYQVVGWNMRRLAAQACGRVQDRECVVALGQRAKYDSDSDVQQVALDALVARCSSGGRAVLADVVSYRAALVVGDAHPNEGQPQNAAEAAQATRKHKAHKKSADKTPAAPAVPTDDTLVQAVVACPSADSVFLLVNAGYGGLEALLASTKVSPTDTEDRHSALKAIAALPPPLELTQAALTEAETKARQEGEAHLAAGREALASGDLDKATREAAAAESLGAAAADLKSATAAARDAEFKRHVQKAHVLVKKDDPDGAMAQVEKAEAIAGGAGSLRELRKAIASTPTERRRERGRKAEELRAEKMRLREEALLAAEARKPGVRETTQGVRDLRKGPCRYDAIGGRMVARVGPRLYEFVPMNASCVTNVWSGGAIVYSATHKDSYGNTFCEHALLETKRTDFSRGGSFSVCVRPTSKNREVRLQSGFKKGIAVWTEDSAGPRTPG